MSVLNLALGRIDPTNCFAQFCPSAGEKAALRLFRCHLFRPSDFNMDLPVHPTDRPRQLTAPYPFECVPPLDALARRLNR